MFEKFKERLKKLGIIYWNGTFKGEEMFDSLNPFEPIIEVTEYPLSKIYREPLKIKITEVYDILMGNHFDLDHPVGKGRVGLLDILIFPLISRRLVAWGLIFFENPANYADNLFFKFLLKFIGFIGMVIGGLFEIPRIFLGICLALLLTFPTIILLHCITYFKREKLLNEVSDLPIEFTHYSRWPEPRSHYEDYDDIGIRTSRDYVLGEKIHELMKSKRESTQFFPDRNQIKVIFNVNHSPLQVSIEIDKNSKSVQALLQLNLFEIAKTNLIAAKDIRTNNLPEDPKPFIEDKGDEHEDTLRRIQIT